MLDVKIKLCSFGAREVIGLCGIWVYYFNIKLKLI